MKKIPKADILKDKHIDHINNEKKISLYKKLNRDFIVTCYETFQHTELQAEQIVKNEDVIPNSISSNYLCFVLEYLPGGDLYTLLKQNNTFKLDDIKFYFAEVVLAIEELHTYNIIYRDLKLDNIMISSDGHIKLIDFGFAKQLKYDTKGDLKTTRTH